MTQLANCEGLASEHYLLDILNIPHRVGVVARFFYRTVFEVTKEESETERESLRFVAAARVPSCIQTLR